MYTPESAYDPSISGILGYIVCVRVLFRIASHSACQHARRMKTTEGERERIVCAVNLWDFRVCTFAFRRATIIIPNTHTHTHSVRKAHSNHIVFIVQFMYTILSARRYARISQPYYLRAYADLRSSSVTLRVRFGSIAVDAPVTVMYVNVNQSKRFRRMRTREMNQ